MAIKTAEKTINDKDVKIVLVNAFDGIKITTQLSKVIFPVISAVQEKKASINDIAMSALAEADQVDMEYLMKKLFDGATVDDFPIKPEVYFTGNYGEMLDFITFALEANFSSFFSANLLKGPATTTRKKSS